jgi:acetolactate synthase-1/2/3 large subunit
MMARMSNLVHKSGAYSDVPIEDRGELVLPGGRLGEIAAYGRPVGTPERIAAYLLTDYLERLGVEVIFGLCGHTLVGLLDAIGKSKIRFVTARHEQVAAHMAEGYARVTGKPGVLITHLGPGLTNAITGIANASLDSVPLVVIAGDVPSYYYGRHPHQELNMHVDGARNSTCVPRGQRQRPPALHRARVSSCGERSAGASAG